MATRLCAERDFLCLQNTQADSGTEHPPVVDTGSGASPGKWLAYEDADWVKND